MTSQKVREELVGKRFLAVGGDCGHGSDSEGSSNPPKSGSSAGGSDRGSPEKRGGSPKLKLSGMRDWHWKAGIIRAASSAKDSDPEIQVRRRNSFIICFG